MYIKIHHFESLLILHAMEDKFHEKQGNHLIHQNAV